MYAPADTRNPWLPPAYGGKNMGGYAKSAFMIPGQSLPQGNALMVSQPPCGCMSGLGTLSSSSWLLIAAAAGAAYFLFVRK